MKTKLTEQEKIHLRMVHDAWMRILTNKGNPKVLYLLGYHWGKIEHIADDPDYDKLLEEILEGPPKVFVAALNRYIAHLPRPEGE